MLLRTLGTSARSWAAGSCLLSRRWGLGSPRSSSPRVRRWCCWPTMSRATRPILVYRVADLGAALVALAARGWERQQSLEIPQGPCCSFRTPGGHRIALYQLTRAEVASHFEGRRDF